MPCRPFRQQQNGVVITGFACSRERHRCACGKRATIQCDFPLTGPKAGKTCDKWLCRGCAVSVGENVDYCQAHAAMRTAKLETGQ